MRTGDEAKLSCTTSSDIQFCAFTAPDGTNFFLKKNIPYEDGRITYAGEDESTDCAVRIASVEEKDNGEWKCSITTSRDGQGVNVENAVSVIVSRLPSDITFADTPYTPTILRGPSDSTAFLGSEVSIASFELSAASTFRCVDSNK